VKAGLLGLVLLAAGAGAFAQSSQKVVDVPTRPGVTERLLVLSPPAPKAAVVLLAGGHGGLQLSTDGSMIPKYSRPVRIPSAPALIPQPTKIPSTRPPRIQ
jgi:hypothetical protein